MRQILFGGGFLSFTNGLMWFFLQSSEKDKINIACINTFAFLIILMALLVFSPDSNKVKVFVGQLIHNLLIAGVLVLGFQQSVQDCFIIVGIYAFFMFGIQSGEVQ